MPYWLLVFRFLNLLMVCLFPCFERYLYPFERGFFEHSLHSFTYIYLRERPFKDTPVLKVMAVWFYCFKTWLLRVVTIENECIHQSQIEYLVNTKIQLWLRMWVRMETKRMKEPNKFPTFLWDSNPWPWYWKTKRRLRCHPVCRNLNVCCFLTVGKKTFRFFFFFSSGTFEKNFFIRSTLIVNFFSESFLKFCFKGVNAHFNFRNLSSNPDSLRIYKILYILIRF